MRRVRTGTPAAMSEAERTLMPPSARRLHFHLACGRLALSTRAALVAAPLQGADLDVAVRSVVPSGGGGSKSAPLRKTTFTQTS
jgi:hypothetical protein